MEGAELRWREGVGALPGAEAEGREGLANLVYYNIVNSEPYGNT